MTLLRSYVGGSWQTPAGEGRPVFDAVTGDEVARISTEGIDMAAALDYGRSEGGPALRRLPMLLVVLAASALVVRGLVTFGLRTGGLRLAILRYFVLPALSGV